MDNLAGNLRTTISIIWGSLFLFCFCLSDGFAVPRRDSQQQIEYARDIQPIIANHCLDCHAANIEDRQSDLLLDSAENWYQPLESGRTFIVPGHRRKSEFFRRLSSPDHSIKMPPPEFANKHDRTISAAQIQMIGKWIDEGGQWQPHWAYQVPKRPPVPAAIVSKKHAHFQANNAIDLFIQHRAVLAGDIMSHRADIHTLLRRLTLDLSGLPPTVEQQVLFQDNVNAHGLDRSWQTEVERLLSSPSYGERMAVHWLDLARYADTHGYHIDSHRDMWRWRDWVIDAFNSNMHFDQFTIEQLAGDLLEKPTLDQLIATGFNRNHMINFEAGALEEEYLSEYIMDRVSTTATVWLGQTIGCSRCHDHKFDPITQKEFYRFYAFFNNVDEVGIDGRAGNAHPYIEAPTKLQQHHRDDLSQSIAQHQSLIKRRLVDSQSAVKQYTELVLANEVKLPGPPNDMKVGFGFDASDGNDVIPHRRNLPQGEIAGSPIYLPGKFSESLLFDGSTMVTVGNPPQLVNDFTLSMWLYPTTEDNAVLFSQAEYKDDVISTGFDVVISEGSIAIRLAESADKVRELRSQHQLKKTQWQHIVVQYSQHDLRSVDSAEELLDEVAIFVDGDATSFELLKATGLLTAPSISELSIGGASGASGFRGMIDEVRAFSRKVTDDEVSRLGGGNPIRTIIDLPENERTDEQTEKLARYVLRQTDPGFEKLQATIDEQQSVLDGITKSISTTMVMSERDEPRKTFVFPSGTYQTKGEEVSPGTPSVLHTMTSEMLPNRLGLANWIVDKRNPLTARVTVNRIWALFFGSPLVATVEDFGTRGSLPSHPKLLDWLAVEFIESGWDVKHLVKLITTSRTYQQSSNQMVSERPFPLYSSFPRQRLTAETIRDAAISNGGLLVDRIGGSSVYPYHPRGLWKEVSFNPRDFTAQIYIQGRGEDLYRRSMYTFWKRTVPPPELAVFDAVNRETCVARRPVTNTPMQALVLMNSPTHVESARGLANQLLRMELSQDDRLSRLFRIVVSRPILNAELLVLTTLLDSQLKAFKRDQTAAQALLDFGESNVIGTIDVTELAAWTVVCSTVMMTDEALYKP